MDTVSILEKLKELTLDFVNGKRDRRETVAELHKRVDANEVYNMEESVLQRQFITEIFVSLENLTEEGFATSPAEMQYLAEVFEGKRTYSQEEIRKFSIGSFEKQNPKNQRPFTS